MDRQLNDKETRWRALMIAAQDGDRSAYASLLSEAAPFLRAVFRNRFRRLSREDIEDLVQDVLLAVHLARSTYDPVRPLMPWLMAIAFNRGTDAIRRRVRLAARETTVPEVPETSDPGEAHLVGEGYGDPEALRAAVATLPKGQRRAVEMLRFRELSLKEAASESGMTVAALKVAVHRATRTLQVILEVGRTNVEIDQLIGRLSGAATPVRRLAAPWRRALIWLAISAPPVFAIVWWHGAAEKAAMAAGTGDARMAVEWLAVLATAISAAVAAFASSIPGIGRRWLWVPLLPLAVWLASVGQGCVADYQALGSAAFILRLDTDCLLPAILAAVVPLTVMLVMLRRGAPMMPHRSLAFAALAVAAVVNLGLLPLHVGDISLMVLVWHTGVAALVAGAAWLTGPLVLRWQRVS